MKKLKIKTLLLGGVLLASMALVCCSKGDKGSRTQSAQSHLSKNVGRISPGTANSNNPYDYIGQMHDNAIVWITNNSLITSANYSSNWNYYNGQFLEQNQFDSTGLAAFAQSSIYTSLVGGMTSGQQISPSQESNLLLANNAISQQESKYLNQICAAVDTNLMSPNTDSSVALICNNIISIENDIQQNVKDTLALKTLLAAASVARYSVSYWLNQFNNPNSTTWFPNTNSSNPTPSYATVGGAATTDCVAAAGASVTWGIYVAAAGTGPVGWGATVVSAGVGASVIYGLTALAKWAGFSGL